jgi:septum formation protein
LIAELLAQAKALAVSAKMPGRLVLAADQTLDVEGVACAKVSGRAEAEDRLRLLSGREHALHSAYCFACDGAVLNAGATQARLSMRPISEAFIAAYLDAAGAAVFDSVAVYEIEGLGIHLFDRTDGDWFTIQGLPLEAVIAFLRNEGLLLR